MNTGSKYQQDAAQLLELVGGRENIAAVSHCVTRMCFVLNDNGCDISDYRAIDPVFGTMEDVEELIAAAARRGIGLMFDMVFNHTSTEHAWFRWALAGEKKYQDYYIFRDGAPDAPPTNWESKFGGSAWAWAPEPGKWYLHLFDKTQADLNWDNPEVREELPVISEGQIAFLCQDCADVFAFRRFLGGDELLVFNNLTGKEVPLSGVPRPAGYRRLIGNYPDDAARNDRLVLRPYESAVYQKNNT